MASLLTRSFQKMVLWHNKFGTADTNSTFPTTGKLTPDEFVAAGDYLVENFPSWQWQGGLEENRKSHLPPDKQFLLTRDVPCLPHPASLNQAEEREVEGEDGEGWIEAGVVDDTVPELESTTPDLPSAGDGAAGGSGGDDSDSDVAELDDFDYSQDALEDDDPASLSAAAATAALDGEDAVVKTRTYDITVCYDLHYSTPRIWLFGYDKAKTPLKADAWQADFSPEHVHKTVTYEQHPHLGFSSPSIHPCKHAAAMLKMISLLSGDGGSVPDVRLYLLIFLKFIQSIIPNIEYDYTSQFEISHDNAPGDDDAS